MFLPASSSATIETTTAAKKSTGIAMRASAATAPSTVTAMGTPAA
jgi:hypothetical protein